MINQLLASTALLASICFGAGVALLWSAVRGPGDDADRAGSITGVRSDAGGSAGAEHEEEKGVESVPPDVPETAQNQEDGESQAVDIRGVRGTDGTSIQVKNTVEGVSSVDGSIQPIRGIEGIDTIAIQNLEAVLRMQSRPTEPDPQGGVSTAAALMTMEGEPQEELEEADEREELEELELEGS
jgi:hypothetical protein